MCSTPPLPASRLCRAATAAEARRQLAAGIARPLAGQVVCVQCPAAGPRAAGLKKGHKEVLERLVRALGGRVAPPRSSSLCVVAGGLGRPCGLAKDARAVKDEWLLEAAEGYRLPEVAGWEVR
jgi:hypothetical protein